MLSSEHSEPNKAAVDDEDQRVPLADMVYEDSTWWCPICEQDLHRARQVKDLDCTFSASTVFTCLHRIRFCKENCKSLVARDPLALIRHLSGNNGSYMGSSYEGPACLAYTYLLGLISPD